MTSPLLHDARSVERSPLLGAIFVFGLSIVTGLCAMTTVDGRDDDVLAFACALLCGWALSVVLGMARLRAWAALVVGTIAIGGGVALVRWAGFIDDWSFADQRDAIECCALAALVGTLFFWPGFEVAALLLPLSIHVIAAIEGLNQRGGTERWSAAHSTMWDATSALILLVGVLLFLLTLTLRHRVGLALWQGDGARTLLRRPTSWRTALCARAQSALSTATLLLPVLGLAPFLLHTESAVCDGSVVLCAVGNDDVLERHPQLFTTTFSRPPVVAPIPSVVVHSVELGTAQAAWTSTASMGGPSARAVENAVPMAAWAPSAPPPTAPSTVAATLPSVARSVPAPPIAARLPRARSPSSHAFVPPKALAESMSLPRMAALVTTALALAALLLAGLLCWAWRRHRALEATDDANERAWPVRMIASRASPTERARRAWRSCLEQLRARGVPLATTAPAAELLEQTRAALDAVPTPLVRALELWREALYAGRGLPPNTADLLEKAQRELRVWLKRDAVKQRPRNAPIATAGVLDRGGGIKAAAR